MPRNLSNTRPNKVEETELTQLRRRVTALSINSELSEEELMRRFAQLSMRPVVEIEKKINAAAESMEESLLVRLAHISDITVEVLKNHLLKLEISEKELETPVEQRAINHLCNKQDDFAKELTSVASPHKVESPKQSSLYRNKLLVGVCFFVPLVAHVAYSYYQSDQNSP